MCLFILIGDCKQGNSNEVCRRPNFDPTGGLRGALPAVRPTHFAAITDPRTSSRTAPT